MSAKYDFYKNPSSKGSDGKPSYHARIVGGETITTSQLAQIVHSRCSLTTADVEAALIALSEVITEELEDGNQIHLKGIGFLKTTISCPELQSPKGIRAESIHFKSVAFRPEISLKNGLKTMRFERVVHKRHSNELTREEMDARLMNYFANHATMTSRDFQKLCGYTRPTANRYLQALRQEGKIQNIGFKKAAIYETMPGYYGKPAEKDVSQKPTDYNAVMRRET